MVENKFARVPGVDETMEGATKGIVSVSHPIAAEAGRAVLEQGGNAIDAAAAIQLSLNVVEPYMSGIGGGGYVLLYLKEEDKIISLDARETVGQNADPDFYLDDEGNELSFFETNTSPKATATPGILKLLETMLDKYGTKELSELIEPAIKQAEEGIEVNWATEKYTMGELERIQKYQATKEVFMPDGIPIKEGDRLVQPELAKTLRIIKEEGINAFYNGEIGEALVAELQKLGGNLTLEDLSTYTVKEREPVRANYRGYEVASMGPSSSGGIILIQILKILEKFDIESMRHNSSEYLHHLIETMHLSYADRAKHIADEDFITVPKKGLLCERYIQERSALINPEKTMGMVQPGDPWKYEEMNQPDLVGMGDRDEKMNQTTHFSVIDKWGNMVSFTSSIGMIYGSGIMIPNYGFLLSNHGGAFDKARGGMNEIKPFKRALSSMSPTILLKDGKPFMAIGSPGATTIIASVAQTIINVIDFKMPIQKAILSPRIYSSTYPRVEWEAGIDQDTILKLMVKGHIFEEKPQRYIGDVHAVIYDNDNKKMYGGTDDTREGTVLGVDNVAFTIDQPSDPVEPEQTPFTLMINNAVMPYLASQMLVNEGKCLVQANKLLLGLGIENEKECQKFEHVVDGTSYLPVQDIGELFGYKVSWGKDTLTVLLEKDDLLPLKPTNSEVYNFYRFDKEGITR